MVDALMEEIAVWEKENAGRKPGDQGPDGRRRLPVVA